MKLHHVKVLHSFKHYDGDDKVKLFVTGDEAIAIISEASPPMIIETDLMYLVSTSKENIHVMEEVIINRNGIPEKELALKESISCIAAMVGQKMKSLNIEFE